MKKYFLFFIIFLFFIFSNELIFAASKYSMEEEFFAMQEQVVVSASKRAQKISDAPVSIGVVTRDEIENLGAQSLPEALRMVAGVYVQQINGGQYEVAIRGTANMPPSNGPFSALSRSILVLIDGRSFFNDCFGGTAWEFLPITINDIERIEIVRGPASPLFGANAVTGVINIITREPAKVEKEIIKLSTSYGYGRAKHNLYYADKSDKFFVSISAERSDKEWYKYEEYDFTKMAFVPGRGDRGDDNFQSSDKKKSLETKKGMLTLNYSASEKTSVDLKAGLSDGFQGFVGGSGDFLMYKAFMSQQFAKLTYQTKILDNVIKLSYSRIKMNIGESEEANAGGDNNFKDGIQNGIGILSDDIELQSIINISENDILVAGLNYRDVDAKSNAVYFKDAKGWKNQKFKAAYVNNEYSFIKDKLKLIIACRVDQYNIPDITEYSPQVALFYKHNENHTFKLNYSEAIRTPFIAELYLNTITTPGVFIGLQAFGMGNFVKWYGNPNLEAPRIKSYEISYLTKLTEKSNMDITLFTHKVTDLISFDPSYGDPFYLPNPKAVITATFKNITDDYKTYGAELSYKLLLSQNWNLWSNFTYQSMKLGSNKIDFTPGKLANIGLNGRLNDKIKLSVSANYASKTDVPVQNTIDRNLDFLKYDVAAMTTAQKMSNPTFLAAYGVAAARLNNDSGAWLNILTGAGYLTGAQKTALISQSSTNLLGILNDTPTQQTLGITNSTTNSILYGLGNGLLASSMLYNSLQNTSYEKTNEYILFNAKLSYAINEKTEFALTGINIFDKRHREYAYGEELGASYMATLTFEF